MFIKNILKEFKDFATRGSVIDLAIGVVVGGAFNSIVNSLVKDIIMPIIGLLTDRFNFSNKFLTLNGEHYATLADAERAGVAIIRYGDFLSAVINFLIVAFTIFILVKQLNKIHSLSKSLDPNKTCPFCQSKVNRKATKCPFCTSPLPIEDEL